jgi:hypothetical protein
MAIKRNFILDIATPTPRRWTRYRGLTSDGRRGLIISGNYYRTMNITVPGIERNVNAPPLSVTIAIGNTDNLGTDLVFDAVNCGQPVTITRLTFADTPWDENLPPVIASQDVWFEGYLGRPSFRGERVLLECHADVGRTAKSPSTSSATLMHSHQTPPEGTKLTGQVTVWR